ncbi:MAG: phage tail protein [Vicinamibacteria bacterium]
MRNQRFPKRALVSIVWVLVAALGAFEILARAGGAEESKDARSSNLLRARSPRFTVALQLEEAGISAVFRKVSGLESENEVVEFRDGNDPTNVRKVPGNVKWGNIVLERTITGDQSLAQWRRLVESGNVADARSNGRIVLLDRGNPVASWQFVNAWPAKLTGPELDCEKNEVATEAITIVHEGMMRVH